MKQKYKVIRKIFSVVLTLVVVIGFMPQMAAPAYAADPVYDITFYHDSIYGEGEAGHLTGSSTEWDHPTWGSDTWVGSARLRPKVYYEAGNDHFTLKVNISRMNGAHQPGGNYVSGTVKYNGHTITFKNWGPFGCGSDWVDIRFERTSITFDYNGGRNYTQGTNNISADYYWYNANNFSIVDTYNGKNFDIENQPWWEAYPPVSSNTIFDGWWTERTGGTRITTEDITKLSGTMTLYAHWEPYYLVELVGGRNVTPSRGRIDAYAHHDTEVVQGSAMEPVVFTANEGYHIDHNSIDDVMEHREGTDVYTQNGVTVERISDTRYVASGTPTGPVHIWIPNGHKYENWTTTTAATCTTAGAKERVCKYDDTIKETATIPIDSNAHSYKFNDFTWTGSEADGYTAAVANYECEHNSEHTITAPATVSEGVVTDPTCTEPGKTTYTATVAAADSPDGEKHEKSKDAKATEATKHKWEFEGFTWTGDETNGYTAAVANYVCENDDSHTETAVATISDPVVIDPTCTEAGKTTYTATVSATDSIDGQEHTECKDAKPTDPIKHKWKFTNFTWTGSEADGYTVAVANYVCENNSGHTTTVDATLSDTTIDSTCTEAGKTTYTATVSATDSIDGQEHTESKDAKPKDPIQHSWGEPTYTWADDNSNVTAKRVCANDATHVETETVDATSEVTKKATCTEKGETTYTSAAFDNEAFKIQKKTIANIDAIGHKYGEWTKLDDKQHQKVCEHNKAHVEKANHTWDAGKVTKAATEKAEGIKTYTCTVCGETKTEVIPKLKPEPTPKPTPNKSTAKPVLVAKAIASGKTAANISWNKIKDADRYEIYMSKCNYKGKKYTMKKVKTVNAKTFKWAKKGLKKNTAYRFYVKVLKKSGKTYKAVAKSMVGHFLTGNARNELTNPKSLKLNKSKLTIKKGKSATIKGTVTKVKKNKKLATSHAVKLRFISNNPSVATVNAKGKVTAKKAGTATIYVQTINGIWKTCKVTVK